MEIKKYLPLGTVLSLKDAKKRIMIIGYIPVGNKDGERVAYDYAACLYPEGMISSDKNLLFNHEQIEKIYFIGNNDAETRDFLEKLNEISREDAVEALNEKEKEKENKNEDLIIED